MPRRGASQYLLASHPPEENPRHESLNTVVCGQDSPVRHWFICLRELIRTFVSRIVLTFPFPFCRQALVFIVKSHFLSGYLAYLAFQKKRKPFTQP